MTSMFSPAGPAHWLFPKLGRKDWHVVACSSFEARCLATARWMLSGNARVCSGSLLRIENPQSTEWQDAEIEVNKNYATLLAQFQPFPYKEISVKLLDPVSKLTTLDGIGASSKTSVVLDISAMPKRFFLFAFKQLMASATVKDLVITYSRAISYPETPLARDALPPTALQGFGRISTPAGGGRLVVGVGFVALSVSELLETAKSVKLDFIFPFPPASPSFRRNWNLLSLLLPDREIPRNTEIHRIHALDPFEVCSRIVSWSQDGTVDIDMIPLGPKPHALGMAMAYLRLNGRGELIYSQPQTYGAMYSKGIAEDEYGRPQITAYCVKRDGRALF